MGRREGAHPSVEGRAKKEAGDFADIKPVFSRQLSGEACIEWADSAEVCSPRDQLSQM